jgi:hypothetical protein
MQAEIYMHTPKIIPVKFRTLSSGYGKEDYQKFPHGLTFYKDFTQGKNLNADYSRGSGLATFTNTSSNTPVFDSNGISLGTARDDVLSYAILNNRTAAQETIVIKFTPDSNFVNDGLFRNLTSTNIKDRTMYKGSGSTTLTIKPNSTDNATVTKDSTTAMLQNINYTIGVTFQHLSPYITVYLNGSSQATYTTGDWTTNVWGTNFYIGSNSSGANQLNGSISKVAIFNRTLTTSEVASVSYIFN